MADALPIARIGNEDNATEGAGCEILQAYNRRTGKWPRAPVETWRKQPDANDRCKPIVEVDLDCGRGDVARSNIAPVMEALQRRDVRASVVLQYAVGVCFAFWDFVGRCRSIVAGATKENRETRRLEVAIRFALA